MFYVQERNSWFGWNGSDPKKEIKYFSKSHIRTLQKKFYLFILDKCFLQKDLDQIFDE